jgi:hypothetical protein
VLLIARLLSTTLSNCTFSFLRFKAGQQLSGSIPEELAHLPFLRQISLFQNELYGTLPQRIISNMKWLTSLELNSNFLSGSIPPELFTFKNLAVLNLGDNQYVCSLRICGVTTDGGYSIVFSHQLLSRFLFSQRLTGRITIPEDAKAESLKSLYLYESGLTGPIPSEIGLLSKLGKYTIQKE